MWQDNETSDDLIGFQVHADLIRAVVTNPKMLPTIIGVFGDWGGGKTSIMKKMLENDLTPEEWPADSPENVFQLHGVDRKGRSVLARRVRREQLLKVVGELEPCLIGIEASAHSIGNGSSRSSVTW
jgi:hypothetical protein